MGQHRTTRRLARLRGLQRIQLHSAPPCAGTGHLARPCGGNSHSYRSRPRAWLDLTAQPLYSEGTIMVYTSQQSQSCSSSDASANCPGRRASTARRTFGSSTLPRPTTSNQFPVLSGTSSPNSPIQLHHRRDTSVRPSCEATRPFQVGQGLYGRTAWALPSYHTALQSAVERNVGSLC